MTSLTEFLSAFYLSADEDIFLRTFNAKGIPNELERPAQNIRVTRNQLASDKQLQQKLKTLNEEQGIYFVVNAGGTKKADITRINAIYCEKDDVATLEEQHDLYDNAPIPPSIRVETARSVHAYWLMSEIITIEEFCEFQQGLIQFFKSDPSIKEQNRVMRLPHFKHVSFDTGEYIYKPVKIHTFTERRFAYDELKEAYPYVRPKNEKYASPVPYGNYDVNTLEGVKVELRRRISELPSYRVENKEYASAQGVCHSGKSKSCLTVNLISGYVYCRHGCDFETILNTFNLSIPKPQKQTTAFKIVQAPAQSSELYRYLQGLKEQVS